MKKIARKAIKNIVVFVVLSAWLLSGWPALRFGPNLQFPPSIPKVYAVTNTETFTSSTTWTAPPGVTTVTAECWGGGGAGGGSTSGTRGGSGGGGGAYALRAVSVTSGTGYTVTVGTAGSGGTGAGGTGNTTTFTGNASAKCSAVGGNGGAANGGAAGAGGLGSASDGSTVHDGGGGFTTVSTTGGGGGGSAGTAANGNTATNATGASAVSGGGNGGNGTAPRGAGQAPTTPPGGGGGGSSCQAKSNGTCGTGSGTVAQSGGGGADGQIKLTYTVYTVLGNGTDPGNSAIGPGGSATEIDRFSFADSFSTDTVTGLTVTLGPAGAFNNVGTIDVQTTGGSSKCSTSSISSNTVSLSSCAIAVTTTATEYKIMITPKTHSAMPAPSSGQSYATTATVTGWTQTSTNTQTGTDSGSATVTIDNLSPSGATLASSTGGAGKATLDWTTSSSGDFDTTNGSVILRWSGSSAGSEVPAEGDSSYVATNTIGTATVACVISSNSSTALSKVDGLGGSAGCTTSALAAGSYTYVVFQRDQNGNYDTGVSMGTVTVTSSNQAPTAPTTLWANERASGAQSGVLNPVALGDGTPAFSAEYTDPDTNDVADFYEVIVYSDAACSSQLWDSTKTALTPCTAPNRCADITYGGSALPFDGNQYSWKIRYWDTAGAQGALSACNTFTELGPANQLRHGNYFFNNTTERVFTW